MRTLGIYLGTFDPIHNGHLEIARQTQTEFGLDQVLLLPLYDAPHKLDDIVISPTERFHMCKLAIESIDKVEASSLEIDHQLKGYAIELVTVVSDAYPDDHLYYILGSDVFKGILDWPTLDALIPLVTFCIVVRSAEDRDKIQVIKQELEKKEASVVICNFKTPQISSTLIRHHIQKGLSVTGLLPKVIDDYIKENNLYKKPTAN